MSEVPLVCRTWGGESHVRFGSNGQVPAAKIPPLKIDDPEAEAVVRNYQQAIAAPPPIGGTRRGRGREREWERERERETCGGVGEWVEDRRSRQKLPAGPLTRNKP